MVEPPGVSGKNNRHRFRNTVARSVGGEKKWMSPRSEMVGWMERERGAAAAAR